MKITWTDIAIVLNDLTASIAKAQDTLSPGDAGVAHTAASRLERTISVIGAGGLRVSEAEAGLVSAGRFIDAIKAYRLRTGQGLYESKCAIDKVRSGEAAVPQ